MKIKDLSKDERPRERLQKHGPKSLSNSELLALVLRQGSKKESVLEMANKLLTKYHIKSISRKTVSDLMKTDGIGEAKAC